MRCKCCDSPMGQADLIKNKHTGYDDDLCRRCRGVVYATLIGVEIETQEDEAEMGDVATNLEEIGEEWVPPTEST